MAESCKLIDLKGKNRGQTGVFFIGVCPLFFFCFYDLWNIEPDGHSHSVDSTCVTP